MRRRPTRQTHDLGAHTPRPGHTATAPAVPLVVTTITPTHERCPRCAGPARLDLFDLDRALADLTCLDCGRRFHARSPRA
jgi:hypothetical protein